MRSVCRMSHTHAALLYASSERSATCCMLFVACCLLYVVRCTLHVVRYMLHFVCCMLYVACGRFRCEGCMMSDACCMLHVCYAQRRLLQDMVLNLSSLMPPGDAWHVLQRPRRRTAFHSPTPASYSRPVLPPPSPPPPPAPPAPLRLHTHTTLSPHLQLSPTEHA